MIAAPRKPQAVVLGDRSKWFSIASDAAKYPRLKGIATAWSSGGSRATAGIHDTVDRRDPACLRVAPQPRQMPQQPRGRERCGRSTPALPGSGSSQLREPSVPPLSTLDGTAVAAIAQFE